MFPNLFLITNHAAMNILVHITCSHFQVPVLGVDSSLTGHLRILIFTHHHQTFSWKSGTGTYLLSPGQPHLQLKAQHRPRGPTRGGSAPLAMTQPPAAVRSSSTFHGQSMEGLIWRSLSLHHVTDEAPDYSDFFHLS